MSSFSRFLAREKRQTQYTEERQHLKHPIPYSMTITPIGEALTRDAWEKFCNRYLTPKLQQECERKIDGTITFFGEGGLDVAKRFQERFKNRFHLRMMCSDKTRAIEGLQLASERNLKIHSVHYKKTRNDKVMLNDETSIYNLLH